LLHLRAPDCFNEIEALKLPLTEGTLLQAKLKLEVIGGSTRPVTVNVRAPSRIEVSQRRHETLVDRFLTEIGIRGRPGPHAMRTLWSLSPWRHARDVWYSVFGRDTDRLIESGVLRPTRLDRIPNANEPAAGRTLAVVPLGDGEFYGVSTEPDLPSRTLTATDLDGFEFQPETFRQLLRSQLGVTELAPSWDGVEPVLDLGPVTIGEHRLYLAYAIRRPSGGVGERLRRQAGGAPVVLLVPSTEPFTVDLPAAAVQHTLPSREEVIRAGIAAAGLQSAVPAVYIVPDGVRLVVDRARGMVWVDGLPINGLKPGSHPFQFVTLLAEAMGHPVDSLAIKAALSDARRDDNTVTRQAKAKANQAIREAMAAAGRAFEGDPFPPCGTGLYRCTLPSYVG
jgi:hypothetical protein